MLDSWRHKKNPNKQANKKKPNKNHTPPKKPQTENMELENSLRFVG